MKVGRVVGTVVSTIQHEVFDGRRLLVVDILGADGEPAGDYLICVDSVGAGAGEAVLVIDEGNSARQVIQRPTAPVRSIIVGIVDQLTVDGSVVIDEG